MVSNLILNVYLFAFRSSKDHKTKDCEYKQFIDIIPLKKKDDTEMLIFLV